MKKLKWVLLFIMILLAILFLFATCKKTKALESEVNGIIANISDRDQDQYNCVFVYDLALNQLITNSDVFFIYTSTPSNNNYKMYLNITNDNVLNIYSNVVLLESVNLSSRLLQIQIVEDLSQLYIIVYCLNYSYQRVQGVVPVVDGITRTMVTRYQLPNDILTAWESNEIYISSSALFNYNGLPYNLLNYSYIDSSDIVQDINNWVDNLLYNYGIYNNMLTIGYNFGTNDGYDEGYEDGLDEGEDIGYSNGYDEGYDEGHDDGYFTGRTEGLEEGERIGYNIGYADGQAGNTAITPVFNTLSGIFSVVGSVLAIELVPHIPLGIFILVPLFFTAIGLILWIWRRN